MKKEIRAAIHYEFLRETEPKEIYEKMKIAYKQNAPVISTVYKWHKRFVEGRESLEDDQRSGRPLNDLDNTRILEILNQQPFASSRYIADVLVIPKSTVCFKLVHQLHYRKLKFKWVPHEISPENKIKRVTMSQDILNILNRKSVDLNNVLTGDEVWIYWQNFHQTKWMAQGEKMQTIPKQTIGSKKSMFSIFFSMRGFIVVKVLPQDHKFDSDFMTNIIIPEIVTQMHEFRPKMGPKDIYLHMDNAPCHNAKVTTTKIESFEMRRIPHPPYSPDISPCDFWLFGKLKNFLKGQCFSTENELFDAVVNFLKSITKDEIKRVYDEWIKRLNMVIQSKGEYILK